MSKGVIHKMLKKIIDWIKAWLWSPSQNKLEVIHYESLEHIDAQGIEKKFKLREEAQRLGAGGVPKQDSKSPSGPEREALNEVEIARRGYQTWATRRLATIDSEITSYDIRHEINQALSEDETFRNKVGTYLTNQNETLERLSKAVIERESELEKFKVQNNIERLPNFPSGGKVFLSYALLIFLILIEGVANGSFFQRGLEGGLREGITYAALFALMNVSFTFACGRYIYRFVFHKDTSKNIIGWFGLLMALSFCVFIGLILGHFRLALNSQADEAFKVAWDSFNNSPLSLGGIDSVLLFFVTIFFGIISFLDGLYLDDLYPGYGEIYRRYQEALVDYDFELEEIHQELQETRDVCVSHLDKTVASTQGAMAGLHAQIIEKRAAGQRLDAAMRTAQSAANAAVHIFRTENQLARGDRPSPEYFNSEAELLHLDLPVFDTTENEQVASEQAALIGKLVHTAPSIREKIEASFNEKYDLLNPLSAQFGMKIKQ